MRLASASCKQCRSTRTIRTRVLSGSASNARSGRSLRSSSSSALASGSSCLSLCKRYRYAVEDFENESTSPAVSKIGKAPYSENLLCAPQLEERGDVRLPS